MSHSSQQELGEPQQSLPRFWPKTTGPIPKPTKARFSTTAFKARSSAPTSTSSSPHSTTTTLFVLPPTVIISARTGFARTDRIARVTSRFRPARSSQHTVAFTLFASPSHQLTVASSQSPGSGHASDGTKPGSPPSPHATSSACFLNRFTCSTTSASNDALSD